MSFRVACANPLYRNTNGPAISQMPQSSWNPLTGGLGSIAVDDALQPQPAYIGRGTTGENRRVFAWNLTLIHQLIGDPPLQLLLCEPAVVLRRAEPDLKTHSASA